MIHVCVFVACRAREGRTRNLACHEKNCDKMLQAPPGKLPLYAKKFTYSANKSTGERISTL
jgi:hypothetical protein